MLPPRGELGAEGPDQSNHCEEKGRRVRLMRVCVRFETAGCQVKLLRGDAECRVRWRFPRGQSADPLVVRWKRAVNPLQNLLSENHSIRYDRMQCRANASSL